MSLLVHPADAPRGARIWTVTSWEEAVCWSRARSPQLTIPFSPELTRSHITNDIRGGWSSLQVAPSRRSRTAGIRGREEWGEAPEMPHFLLHSRKCEGARAGISPWSPVSEYDDKLLIKPNTTWPPSNFYTQTRGTIIYELIHDHFWHFWLLKLLFNIYTINESSERIWFISPLNTWSTWSLRCQACPDKTFFLIHAKNIMI